jgi:hypothetical protein
MSQWMAAIHRDRYMVVRDERDAYQQLQDQFSGQMDFTTKMMEENGIEKERLTQEIAQGQKQLDDALRIISEAFATINVSSFHSASSHPVIDSLAFVEPRRARGSG